MTDRLRGCQPSSAFEERRGEWRITQKGISVCILTFDDKFVLSMNAVKGKIKYDSIFDAKLKALDVIDSGEAPKFPERRRAKSLQSRQYP